MADSGKKRTTVFQSLRLQICILAGALIMGVIVSSGMGYMNIPFLDVSGIILDSIFGTSSFSDGIADVSRVIIMDVRLPRILTSAIVGAGLAISGAVFQGILLNPLADPYTLGVSAGAAFGASIAILFIPAAGVYAIPACAFAGALITLFFVMYLSSSSGGLSSNNLILSGIIVAAILSAGTSFLKYLADEQVSTIIFWLMGSFTSKTWIDVSLTFIFVSAGFCVFIYLSRDLDIMVLGDKTAASLGVDTRKITFILLIVSTLVAAVCVSVSGIIGFVGLLVPHLMRFVTGPDNRRLIPVSMLAGALLLMVADTLTRAVLPNEIPIGVLTALTGGPFFCYVFVKSHSSKGGAGA